MRNLFGGDGVFWGGALVWCFEGFDMLVQLLGMMFEEGDLRNCKENTVVSEE